MPPHLELVVVVVVLSRSSCSHSRGRRVSRDFKIYDGDGRRKSHLKI